MSQNHQFCDEVGEAARKLLSALPEVAPAVDEPCHAAVNVRGQITSLNLDGHYNGLACPVDRWHGARIAGSTKSPISNDAEVVSPAGNVGSSMAATLRDEDGKTFGVIQKTRWRQ